MPKVEEAPKAEAGSESANLEQNALNVIRKYRSAGDFDHGPDNDEPKAVEIEDPVAKKEPAPPTDDEPIDQGFVPGLPPPANDDEGGVSGSDAAKMEDGLSNDILSHN